MPNLIPFGEYRPDLADYESSWERDVLNVVPRGDGYGPFPNLTALSLSLGAACRGAFEAINSDGSVTVFAATSTDLYLYNNTTSGWSKVSQGGVSYPAVPSVDNWWWLQFNNLVICGQVNVVPQVWTLGTSAAFANLAAANPAPAARYGGVVGQFVVLTGLASNSNRVQWSGLDDVNGPNSWTPGYTNFSDFQDLVDGGITRGIAGGESGVVFQDTMIRRLIYLPNDPRVFQIEKISETFGIYGANSLVRAGSTVFFYSLKGFHRIDLGQLPAPIGRERVDRTFFGNLDVSNLQLFQGVADPRTGRIIWAYKSVNGASGKFDSALCYDPALDRWAPLSFSGEYLLQMGAPGVSLEGLDFIAPNNTAVLGTANNGSGLIRVTIANTASLAAPVSVTLPGLGTVNAIYLSIQNVVGTTEANGLWWAQIVNGSTTQFDLLKSTFTNAYVSGGTVGGQLDLMTQSLDSFALALQPELAAFDGNHVLNFFHGTPLQAILETAEQGTSGQRIKMKKGFRPVTDAATVYGSFSARENLQQAVTYGAEVLINAITGIINTLLDTRYARIKVRIPAGTSWTYIEGVEPTDLKPTGKR